MNLPRICSFRGTWLQTIQKLRVHATCRLRTTTRITTRAEAPLQGDQRPRLISTLPLQLRRCSRALVIPTPRVRIHAPYYREVHEKLSHPHEVQILYARYSSSVFFSAQIPTLIVFAFHQSTRRSSFRRASARWQTCCRWGTTFRLRCGTAASTWLRGASLNRSSTRSAQ